MINDHSEKTGIGNYFFQLHRELMQLHRSDFAFDVLMQNVKRQYQPLFPEISHQSRPFPLRDRGFGLTYDLLATYYFPRRIPTGYGLYHISSQMMGASNRFARPAVITCHDIMPFQVKHNHNSLSEHLRRQNIQAMTHADRIIFVSSYSRQDFLNLFDYDPHKTCVIHEGVSDVFQPRDKRQCRQELGLPLDRPIILHIGTEAERKNIPTLLEVTHRLTKEIPNILLVRKGHARHATRRRISKMNLAENVLYLRKSPAEERIARMYNAADVFLFPSLYEGFGLPAMEAMKSGCPLVASNVTSIPEITGEAALLHNPDDVGGFAASIRRVLTDDVFRENCIQKGLRQAANFSWQKTARETMSVYEGILHQS